MSNKNKYLIIKKDKYVVGVDEYLLSKDLPGEFKHFVELEAVGSGKIRQGNCNANSNPKKPKYLSYAHKLGFAWEPNSDAGFAQYDYKGALIVRLIKEYARELVNKIGFPVYEVHGSNVFDLSHPVVNAYANLYGDRLFQFKSGKKDVVMSYDASYPQFNMAARYKLNHKQLPFAHFSLADCYRHEQSGECMLLHRQRRFYMADLHPYFKDVAEAFAWYPKIEEQLLQSASEVKIEYQVVVEVSSEENWQKYKKDIIPFAARLNRDILVSIINDGKDRYWIINVDYKIIDQLDQSREICCIQIDVNNAERLDIKYSDKDGKYKYPVIIHSAIPGGIERYIYMLLDNFEKSFPLWLYPVQIRLIPVGEKQIKFCQSLIKKYSDKPVRIDIDDRAESVAKKIKGAHSDLIPLPVVIGEREEAGDLKVLDYAIEKVAESSSGKPFLRLDYPNLLSMQVR